MLKTTAVATFIAVAALASSASAETRIGYDRLDTPAGAARFDAAVRRAGYQICNGTVGVARTKCLNEVRAQAVEQLPRNERLAYAQTRGQADGLALAALNANEG